MRLREASILNYQILSANSVLESQSKVVSFEGVKNQRHFFTVNLFDFAGTRYLLPNISG
jgi:hypothetical protein